MSRLVLSGGRLIDPTQSLDDAVDIAIEDGVVAEIGKGLSGAETLDVTGLIVAPGFIDIHVHLREPGFEYKETIETATAAAVAGGFVGVVGMPNTNPPPDTAAAVRGLMKRAESASCRVFTMGTITKGRQGEELAEMGDLVDAGVVGFSDDGDPVNDAGVMRLALDYCTMFDRPVAVHAEDRSLSNSGHMHEGAVSAELGIPAIPSVASDVMAARDLLLAEYTGGRLHLMHMSTAGEVSLLSRSKADGI